MEAVARFFRSLFSNSDTLTEVSARDAEFEAFKVAALQSARVPTKAVRAQRARRILELLRAEVLAQ